MRIVGWTCNPIRLFRVPLRLIGPGNELGREGPGNGLGPSGL